MCSCMHFSFMTLRCMIIYCLQDIISKGHISDGQPALSSDTKSSLLSNVMIDNIMTINNNTTKGQRWF